MRGWCLAPIAGISGDRCLAPLARSAPRGELVLSSVAHSYGLSREGTWSPRGERLRASGAGRPTRQRPEYQAFSRRSLHWGSAHGIGLDRLGCPSPIEFRRRYSLGSERRFDGSCEREVASARDVCGSGCGCDGWRHWAWTSDQPRSGCSGGNGRDRIAYGCASCCFFGGGAGARLEGRQRRGRRARGAGGA